MLLDSRAFRLWAKTGPEPTQWHALPFHLLDVGAAAEALWDSLPVDTQQLIHNYVAADSNAKQLCVFFAASHDVGKANRYFQGKVEWLARELQDLGVIQLPEPERHGQATNAYLSKWLQERWGWPVSDAACLASCVGGHHGTFFANASPHKQKVHEHPWLEIGDELLDTLAALTGIDNIPAPPARLSEFVGWLAGFVTVADWLGSHDQMTVFQTKPCDLREYFPAAKMRATGLLAAVGFTRPTAGDAVALQDLLPPGSKPNEMQTLAQRVSQDGFRLAIIEAPTGEGKTEAAITLADPSRARGNGMYFALPTMATANGLFDRVERYLSQANGGNSNTLRLLHSLAWLYRDEIHANVNPGDGEQGRVVEDWFAGCKRGLLAPYGVGTIDQALVGALQVKHFFIRLFALAGKTVVVDEVHAYDSYMTDLLTVLLDWLRVLGCQVVLLSATLPNKMRDQLLAAWGVDRTVRATYPCITWVDDQECVRSESFTVERRKPLRIQFIDSSQLDPVTAGAEAILGHLQNSGGSGALMFNTVARAQTAYQALKPLAAGAGIDCFLFHARFTAEDRESVERMVLNRVGRDANRGRPCIVVATQVIEQSLDLDFDHMVSELAPIDLLIQRAGRLHRHRRDANGAVQPQGERDARPDPVLYVIPPTYGDDELPELERSVYDRAIQMKTEVLLSKVVMIDKPEDVFAAVEAVYGGAEQEDDRLGAIEKLKEYEDARKKTEAGHHDLADEVTICSTSNRYTVALYKNRFEEDDEQPTNDLMAKTRIESLVTLSIVVSSERTPAPQGQLRKDQKRRLAMQTVKTNAIGKRLEGLLDLPCGAGWENIKAFRHSKLAELDFNGTFVAGEYSYRYDSEIGLTWEKLDAQL